MSRIDAKALADCSVVLVRLQQSCDRLVSSSCVAPRTSEHWQRRRNGLESGVAHSVSRRHCFVNFCALLFCAMGHHSVKSDGGHYESAMYNFYFQCQGYLKK